MSPAEAGAMLDEPDWKQRFEELKRDRELPPHLAQDAAFEDVLKEWRKFHFTWGTKAKQDGSLERIPANAVDGIIRLAQLESCPRAGSTPTFHAITRCTVRSMTPICGFACGASSGALSQRRIEPWCCAILMIASRPSI